MFVPAVIFTALGAFAVWFVAGPTPQFTYALIIAVTVLVTRSTPISAPGLLSRYFQISSTSSWATAAVRRPCLPLLPRKMSANRELMTARKP